MRRAGGLLQRGAPGFPVYPKAKRLVRTNPERRAFWYEQGSRVRKLPGETVVARRSAPGGVNLHVCMYAVEDQQWTKNASSSITWYL